MGNACCAHSHNLQEDKDLPMAKLTNITDPQEKWQKSYPFYRTPLNRFIVNLNKIGKQTFAPAELGKLFKSPAWQNAFE